MQFALQLGNLDWQRLKDVAQAAEELGFNSIMMPDHIIHEGPERQANLEFFAYEALVKAAVLIEATKRVEVGHLVLCNLFRHPVITAQALMSLDTLSGGRTFCGMGTGWTETEFRMTGIAFPDIGTRLRMLDEALTVMRSLFSEPTTTFAGEFYHLQDAVLHPKPIRKPYPPILLGGGGKGLLRLAAKHADVVNIISETGRPAYISIAEVAKLTDEAFRAQGSLRARGGGAPRSRSARDRASATPSSRTIISDTPEATRAAPPRAWPPSSGCPAEVVRTDAPGADRHAGAVRRRAATAASRPGSSTRSSSRSATRGR